MNWRQPEGPGSSIVTNGSSSGAVSYYDAQAYADWKGMSRRRRSGNMQLGLVWNNRFLFGERTCVRKSTAH